MTTHAEPKDMPKYIAYRRKVKDLRPGDEVRLFTSEDWRRIHSILMEDLNKWAVRFGPGGGPTVHCTEDRGFYYRRKRFE